jgi:hypothetical protein
MMHVREQVELALRNYGELEPVPFGPEMPEETAYLATPDRLAFALGWIAANQIVQARYADSAIDALPIYHPEHGWDRFLLTRRVTADRFRNEAANRYGMIMLSGEDAPCLTRPSGAVRLALGSALQRDPEQAIRELIALFPPGQLLPKELGYRWNERKRVYPMLYNAVTELILEHPGVVAAREIYVDDQPVDGAYHPLYLHSVSPKPGVVLDWFLVQRGERAVFFRAHGGQTIYETDRRTWSTVKKQIGQDDPETAKQRIRNWLRIGDSQPQPEVD